MPIRTSSLRSLGAFLNVFAIESFMDELAAGAGADPVEFRLAHLTDPRAGRVIEAAADLAGWAGRPRAEGTGYGLGYARYKGLAGYCAAVAEVEAESDMRVRRLWLAVDVGTVINPDGVINQVEGGAVQSASWATAGSGSLRPGQDHVGELGQLPDPAVHRGARGGRADRRGARRSRRPARARSPRARSRARSATRWPTRSACGCATCRSPASRSSARSRQADRRAPPPVSPSYAGPRSLDPSAQCWPNSALTDSPSWIRRIASARAGASESTVSLPVSPGSGERHGVRADDLGDLGRGGDPVQRAVGEQAVRARDPHRRDPRSRSRRAVR